MSNDTLTHYERKALTVLRDHGPFGYPSAIGYKLFEGEPEKGVRKPNPSPQGMALAAGRFLYKLEKRGLIYRHNDIAINAKGRALLAELERTDGAQANLA